MGFEYNIIYKQVNGDLKLVIDLLNNKNIKDKDSGWFFQQTSLEGNENIVFEFCYYSKGYVGHKCDGYLFLNTVNSFIQITLGGREEREMCLKYIENIFFNAGILVDIVED